MKIIRAVFLLITLAGCALPASAHEKHRRGAAPPSKAAPVEASPASASGLSEWQMFRAHLKKPEYLHVMINPIPIWGWAFGALLLALSWLCPNDSVRTTGLWVILATSASVLPTVWFGERAYDRIYETVPVESQRWLDVHMERAEKFLYLFHLSGALAIAALVAGRRKPRLALRLTQATLISAALSSALTGWIAHAGGQVRHQEFREGPPPASAIKKAILLLALLAPPWLSAQALSATMSLQETLNSVERDNPEILAARKRWQAVSKRVLQAGTPDKPRLDIEKMYAPSGKNIFSEADERSVAVSQEIPFPSTLYLRRGMAAKEAAMAEQSYRAKAREVLARTRSTYAMLYLAQRSLDIFNENIELMRRFAKVAESQYVAGHAGQSDALKAQVELTKMLNMGVVLAQEKESAAAMLNALLNREAGEPIGLPAESDLPKLDWDLASIQALALAERPELKEAALNVERAGKSLAIARSEYLPDFMLQYRQRADPMRGRTRDAVLGLSIPLWFWKPAAMAAEAKAEREMAEAELQGMRVMTSAEARSAWVRTQTARRLADIYRTSVLPQAEQALRVAEVGYQANKSSFLDLLDAQRSLLNFRLERYQFLADYEQRLAELERIVGRGL